MPGSLQEVAVDTEGSKKGSVSERVFNGARLEDEKRVLLSSPAVKCVRAETGPTQSCSFNFPITSYHPSPPPLSLSPENWRAKPCLLVKKSVVNCRLIVLKVLWTSWGSTEPLSSLSRTPPSWGPSQIRSTSWTSSVWKTRKWRLKNKNPKKQTNKKNQTSEALTVDGWVFVMKLMESNLRQKKYTKHLWKKEEENPYMLQPTCPSDGGKTRKDCNCFSIHIKKKLPLW